MDGNADEDIKLFGSVQGEGGAGGDLRLAELGAKHSVHHTRIAAWKRQVVEGMSATFSDAGEWPKLKRRSIWTSCMSLLSISMDGREQ